jgi:hypothetical protein
LEQGFINKSNDKWDAHIKKEFGTRKVGFVCQFNEQMDDIDINGLVQHTFYIYTKTWLG